MRSRDEQQRPSEVEFRASALGRSTHYTLAYDYTQAPDVLAWKMVKGDIQRSIEGAYHLDADRRRRHRGALRPGDRAGRAAARLRQAAGRGAHPQLGPRAEGPRRVLSVPTCPAACSASTSAARSASASSSTPTATSSPRPRAPTPHGGDALIDVLAEIVAELGATAGPVDALGVGVPGLVTHRRRAAVVAEPPRRRPSSTSPGGSAPGSGAPSPVGNDATCAALAEWRVGAGRGVDDMVMVTLGTGIGGGIVAGGRLVVGANGFAGEFGHMVVDPDGPPCPCGRRGCWERYASGSGLGPAGPGGGGRRPAATRRRGRRRRRRRWCAASTSRRRPREGDAGGARRHRRVRPLGRARPRQPDQRPRPGDVRARRRAGRGRRPLPRADRALVRRSCSTRPSCARTRRSPSPSSASTPARSAPRCSPPARRLSATGVSVPRHASVGAA